MSEDDSFGLCSRSFILLMIFPSWFPELGMLDLLSQVLGKNELIILLNRLMQILALEVVSEEQGLKNMAKELLKSLIEYACN